MRGKNKLTLLPFNECDLHWLAGIFEGEGTIRLQSRSYYRNKQGKTYGPYQYPRASVGMIDRDIIERIGDILGVGKMYISISNSTESEPKPIYTWVVSTSEDVIELAKRLYPLMGSRRRSQIDVVLKASEQW